MRHLFDQYHQPENRLTHALAASLDNDPKLLGRFLRRFLPKEARREMPPLRGLSICEQTLPGIAQYSDEKQAKGLPDIWIYSDESSWTLLIENKTSERPTNSQLSRHLRTAARRGYELAYLLVVGTREPAGSLPKGCVFHHWRELYSWLVDESLKRAKNGKLGQNGVEWAKQMATYMEVWEAALPEEDAITEFSGVPFGFEYPYDYKEAKRILKLAMVDLRSRRSLKRNLPIAYAEAGRGKITGKRGYQVWDYIPLGNGRSPGTFTKAPHLTLGIGQKYVRASITLPNGMATAFRQQFRAFGFDGFRKVLKAYLREWSRRFRSTPGACPEISVYQRRFRGRSQASLDYIDGRLLFDLRTAFRGWRKGSSGEPAIKSQPEWLRAAYDAFCNKKSKSNLQMSIGTVFYYEHCDAVRRKGLLDRIEGAWLVNKIVTDVLFA